MVRPRTPRCRGDRPLAPALSRGQAPDLGLELGRDHGCPSEFPRSAPPNPLQSPNPRRATGPHRPHHERRRVHRQVAPRSAHRALRRPAALPRPLRALRPPEAGGGRPHRRLVHLREGRRQEGRLGRLGRRLEARLLRLGVQGPPQGPGRRLPPARPVPRRPREPAAPRHLRHGPPGGPHQLHGHPAGGPRGPARRPGRPAEPRDRPLGLRRPAEAQARRGQRGDHGRRRPHRGRDRGLAPRARLGPPRGRPFPRPPRLLPLRRGHRPPARRPRHPDPRAEPQEAGALRAASPASSSRR